MSSSRNFSTISPSAKTLLFVKAYTGIPFAKEVADLSLGKEPYPELDAEHNFYFWIRALHFENRYYSIDQLLEPTGIKNILELSSGFSFRGLDMTLKKEVHYIDTDLPGLIETKKSFVNSLIKGQSPMKGKLEILPLNALDETSFLSIINRFEPGPILIVNEGLMMYLEQDEKKKLCSIIHSILVERGGYWITADIYIKGSTPKEIKLPDHLQQFLDQHQVEEKKFKNFEEAKEFFHEQGFEIDKEAEPMYATLVSYPRLLESANQYQIDAIKGRGKMHATWRLRVDSR
jgi:O-methyltransferase involved in polyketide biosynthesis